MFDENNSIVSDIEVNSKLWNNYTENLLHDNRKEDKTIIQETDTWPDVTKADIQYALKNVKKNGREPRAANPQTDIVKLVDEKYIEIRKDSTELPYHKNGAHLHI